MQIGDASYSTFKKNKDYDSGWLAIYAYKCALKAESIKRGEQPAKKK